MRVKKNLPAKNAKMFHHISNGQSKIELRMSHINRNNPFIEFFRRQ
jgi:hypothetical protein